MKNRLRKVAGLVVSVAPLALVSVPTQAAIDVTPITDALTDVNAIGIAVFTLIVGAAVYKWIRRAM
ncbi:MAG: phage coat protein [Gammaproteobacteria bacterium]|jgi:hypothetical protein|uniref:Putative capsid protein n=1 Tax=viral metagenome TaxID=1070528 RepID=A0A6M3M3F8_9ZZZZ|nr:phage coat protein [Gammaproteobacteria bacterium]MBU0770970.1 phage coat protein [Gammaproteobacteria bacterium]MBU0856714.1 phage coat protein [Gammaproteobacteria bacterium]MBU1848073.1 phage coat protein [Gammaproteobacteria bacterium]